MSNLDTLADALTDLAEGMKAAVRAAGREPGANRHCRRAALLAAAAHFIASGRGDKAREILARLNEETPDAVR